MTQEFNIQLIKFLEFEKEYPEMQFSFVNLDKVDQREQFNVVGNLPVYRFFKDQFIVDEVPFTSSIDQNLKYAMMRNSGQAYDKMLQFPVFELRNMREFEQVTKEAGDTPVAVMYHNGCP